MLQYLQIFFLSADYLQNADNWRIQSPAVRVTAVTVTVGYSDTFGNPRSITNKTQAVTVTKNRLQ